MRDVDDDNANLTPAGNDRREAILRLALNEAARRRVRRRTARGAAVGVLLAGVVAITIARRPSGHGTMKEPAPLIAQTQRAPALPPSVVLRPTSKPRPRPAEIVVMRIETDTTLADQWAVPREAPTWQKLSDDELLRRLTDAGQPAGLAYVQGRTVLLPREGVVH